MFNPDGTGRMPQFNAPWREPVWILPALYTGDTEHISLANRVVERYAEAAAAESKGLGQRSGMEWGIFQSNTFSHCLHRFEKQLTPGARKVMEWHARETCKTVKGSRQPDYKFHGANDNMPMMGTCGMIFAGETLGIPEAIDHGLWNLQEVRRLLSRAAAASASPGMTTSAAPTTRRPTWKRRSRLARSTARCAAASRPHRSTRPTAAGRIRATSATRAAYFPAT
jgi:hypothetical protein